MMLADELLLLTLSPAEGRNTRSHPGIRAAVCGADLLDDWLIGAPLPGNLRRHISKHDFGSLEPALGRLAAAGRITTSGHGRVAALLGARWDTLHDVSAAAAIRGRLQASLAGPVLPSARDAALAVVVYEGRLWNWAALEAPSTEDAIILGRRQPAATPLKARASPGGRKAPGGSRPAGRADRDREGDRLGVQAQRRLRAARSWPPSRSPARARLRQPVTQTLTPPPPSFETCNTVGNGVIRDGARTEPYSASDTGITCGADGTLEFSAGPSTLDRPVKRRQELFAYLSGAARDTARS